MRLFTKIIVALTLLAAPPAWAQHGAIGTLVVGIEQSSSAQWEIEAIRSLGLDKKHGFTLEARPLADSQAAQAALDAGDVDIILSDFVSVSTQRNQGNKISMVPQALALGGLMVPGGSDIAKIDDLKGKTIAVAGDPLDKSWLILEAYYSSVTGSKLSEDATASFVAAQQVDELLGNGGADAALNLWQWNARAKVAGATELVSVPTMLEELGVSEQPPLLGWTFTDKTGKDRKTGIIAFLDASFEAEGVLLKDDTAWDSLQATMGAERDNALLAQLRYDYRKGIVTSYNPTKMNAAKQAFAILAEYGGSDLIGEKATMDAGTFWRGYRK